MKRAVAVNYDHLAGFKLFRGFTANELSSLLPRMGLKVKKFEKGQVIVDEGEECDKVVLFTKGIANFYDCSICKGRQMLVRSFEEGDVLCLSLVMKASELVDCMVTAETDVEVVLLSGSRFREFLAKRGYKRLFENVVEVFGDYVRFSRQKFTILRQKKAEGRFLLYLRYRAEKCGSGELTLPYPRMEDCAEFLGITRTALSLAIKELVNRGTISHTRRATFILNG